MRHATALLYHVCAVASRNIRFASCGTSGELTVWTRYVHYQHVHSRKLGSVHPGWRHLTFPQFLHRNVEKTYWRLERVLADAPLPPTVHSVAKSPCSTHVISLVRVRSAVGDSPKRWPLHSSSRGIWNLIQCCAVVTWASEILKVVVG
jgi:hypothetical protein